jgi:DNA topoisomerase-3
MTRLFIAEKPDMGKKIASALNGPYKNGPGYIETGEGIVTWCIGHILKSHEPEHYKKDWEKWDLSVLPMIPSDLELKVDIKKKKQFDVIKDLMKNATEIVNAGDPGREGQLIVDEVLKYLKNKKPVKRILLDALDKKSIRTALGVMQDNKNFYNLFLAAECRGYADWLIGINGTRAYTLIAQQNKYKGVLSVGRVQTPTLAIVVRRDEAIETFVPHTYYVINATFSFQEKSFITTWKPNPSTNKDVLDSGKRLIDLATAQSILAKIQGQAGKIIDYTQTQGKSAQPLPFSLSKLQIFANAKWGLSAKDVLDACQSLYEVHELQSYPRTDCQYLKEEHHADGPLITNNIAQAFPHLSNIVQGATLSIKSQAWNNKKLSDHYAIIPTHKVADLTKLSAKEAKIYQAVCERYLAQFYPECEFLSTSITVECAQEHFKATGKIIIKQGWKAVYSNDEEEDTSNTNSEDSEENSKQTLPQVKQNDMVDYVSAKKTDKQTTPPARFTEGTLIAAMTNVDTIVTDPVHKAKLKDKKGIGQESTRTSIIENLYTRDFLVKDGKKIISTPVARVLINHLPPMIIDAAWTAIWEDFLDKIANGTIKAEDFKLKQQQWVTQLVSDAKKTNISIANTSPVATTKATTSKSNSTSNKAAPKTTTTTCPKCNVGTLVERKSKTGTKFLACNQYPKCNHVEWLKK